MLEFLNDRFTHGEGQEGYVVGFNEETKKLIVKTENKKKVEIDLFGSGLTYNIDDYKDWKEQIHGNLLRYLGNNSTSIFVLSTVNTNMWHFEINRSISSFENADGETIEIINYSITYCGEIVGDILSLQKKDDDDFMKEERKFNRWIDQQIEEVELFNHSEYIDDATPSITIIGEDPEDVFYDEFIELIFDMWDEYCDKN